MSGLVAQEKQLPPFNFPDGMPVEISAVAFGSFMFPFGTSSEDDFADSFSSGVSTLASNPTFGFPVGPETSRSTFESLGSPPVAPRSVSVTPIFGPFASMLDPEIPAPGPRISN